MSGTSGMNGMKDASDGRSETTSLLWFEVAGSAMALPVDQVLEIRAPSRCAAVPGAPREVLGLIQHRGRMIPVVDLAERVGGTSWDAESGRAAGAVIIVEAADSGARRACALAVDRVLGVRDRAATGAAGAASAAAGAAGPAAGSILDLSTVFSVPPERASAAAQAVDRTS